MDKNFCVDLLFAIYYTESLLKQETIQKKETRSNFFYLVKSWWLLKLKEFLRYNEIKDIIGKNNIEINNLRKKSNEIKNKIKNFITTINLENIDFINTVNKNVRKFQYQYYDNNNNNKQEINYYLESNIIKSDIIQQFGKNLKIKQKMNNLILKDNNKVIIEINCQLFEVFEINNEFSLIPCFLFIMAKQSKDLCEKLLYYKSFDILMNKENIIMKQKNDTLYLTKDNSLYGYIYLIDKNYKFNNYNNEMIKEIPSYTIQLEEKIKKLEKDNIVLNQKINEKDSAYKEILKEKNILVNKNKDLENSNINIKNDMEKKNKEIQKYKNENNNLNNDKKKKEKVLQQIVNEQEKKDKEIEKLKIEKKDDYNLYINYYELKNI